MTQEEAIAEYERKGGAETDHFKRGWSDRGRNGFGDPNWPLNQQDAYRAGLKARLYGEVSFPTPVPGDGSDAL